MQDKLIRLHNILIDLMGEILIFHFLTRRLKFWKVETFELLYCEVSGFSKDSSDKEVLKSKLKEFGLSSHRRLKHNVLEENLSKMEFEYLKNLSKIPDIIIQKSDKGNSCRHFR